MKTMKPVFSNQRSEVSGRTDQSARRSSPGGERLSRSAELHSAVAQIFNLQRSRKTGGAGQGGHAADCKSAIQQSATLRYDVVRPTSRLLVFAVVLAVMLVQTTRAVIKEPDNLVWGNIVLGTNVVTASQTNIVVEARRSLSTAPLASYRMGASAAAGNFYSLAIPLESLKPVSDPGSTSAGDQLIVLVHNGEFVRYLTLYTVGGRGQITRLDLGDVDGDNNGLIDNWERQYFSAAGQDPNGDPDRDGVSNRNEMLGATNPLVPDARHPADNSPTNNVMTIHEVTAYSLAWKTGKSWPVAPTNIPVDFVARAGFLWKNGEKYIMDTNALALGAPLWWTNLPPSQTNSSTAGLLSMSSSSRFTGKSIPTPAMANTTPVSSKIVRSLGQGTEAARVIRLLVTPADNTSAYVIEEKILEGGSILEVSHEGAFDATTGKLRWGPFFDDEPRELTYRLRLATEASAAGRMVGVGSFDGWNVEIIGESALSAPGELRWNPLQLSVGGDLKLKLGGVAGQQYAIEVSQDLKRWSGVATVTAHEDGSVEFGENITQLNGPRFYRARRLEE